MRAVATIRAGANRVRAVIWRTAHVKCAVIGFPFGTVCGWKHFSTVKVSRTVLNAPRTRQVVIDRGGEWHTIKWRAPEVRPENISPLISPSSRGPPPPAIDDPPHRTQHPHILPCQLRAIWGICRVGCGSWWPTACHHADDLFTPITHGWCDLRSHRSLIVTALAVGAVAAAGSAHAATSAPPAFGHGSFEAPVLAAARCMPTSRPSGPRARTVRTPSPCPPG